MVTKQSAEHDTLLLLEEASGEIQKLNERLSGNVLQMADIIRRKKFMDLKDQIVQVLIQIRRA